MPRAETPLSLTPAPRGLTDLEEILASLSPERRPGIWVYAVLPRGSAAPAAAAASVREAEGVTVVLPEDEALALGLAPLFRAVWITLRVHSCLGSVGLTATVSAALARDGIPCNLLAGFRHDHLLVPEDRADSAMACLGRLQSGHGRPRRDAPPTLRSLPSLVSAQASGPEGRKGRAGGNSGG